MDMFPTKCTRESTNSGARALRGERTCYFWTNSRFPVPGSMFALLKSFVYAPTSGNEPDDPEATSNKMLLGHYHAPVSGFSFRVSGERRASC
jgi:hypothetical protein